MEILAFWRLYGVGLTTKAQRHQINSCLSALVVKTVSLSLRRHTVERELPELDWEDIHDAQTLQLPGGGDLFLDF